MQNQTPGQLREHFELEKELASRLKAAPREERRSLYASLYDELFRRLPHHPQHTRKASAAETRDNIAYQMKALGRFLKREMHFMEIGPGDCTLAIAAAGKVAQVTAVDVSDEITKTAAFPPNFRLVLTDGISIPMPPGSVDLAYSSDLIEHLHPDDALEQTRAVYTALRAGGKYLCVTPNRLGGPWDISGHFSRTAEGFHIKEYSVADLADLFRRIGFKRMRVLLLPRGRFLSVPAGLVILAERVAGLFPYAWRRKAARRFPWAGYVRLIAEK